MIYFIKAKHNNPKNKPTARRNKQEITILIIANIFATCAQFLAPIMSFTLILELTCKEYTRAITPSIRGTAKAPLEKKPRTSEIILRARLFEEGASISTPSPNLFSILFSEYIFHEDQRY